MAHGYDKPMLSQQNS